MLGVCDVEGNEILCSPDEVVKVILSLLFFAIKLPVETFLTTTTDMGDDENTSEIVEENHVGWAKFWLLGITEAAIGGQMGQNWFFRGLT